MDHPKDLAGKGVIVTGACGVIGRWLVEAFLAAGARLALTDHDASALDRLAAELPLTEGSFVFAADLTDAEAVTAFEAQVAARWGAADVLVNNAGVYPSGFLLDIDVAEWDRIFAINLRAPFVLTRLVARRMIAAGVKGSIINVSSGASRKMRRTAVPYCTSKTALDRLTKGFALELAAFGIRVNALEPGFAAGSTVSPLTAEHVAATVAQIPLGRPSSADDVGQAALYLASAAVSYVTGATLTVDGGNSIGSLAVHQAKKTPL